MTKRQLLVAFVMATHAFACGSTNDALDSGPSHGSTSTTTTSTNTSASGESTTVHDDDTPVAELDSGFIPSTDFGGREGCDVWAQDCPVGEKCMPWGRDGATWWNDTRCVPVTENPAATGASCVIEGETFSGVDDCESGAMCWDVEPEPSDGRCVAFCEGSEANPVCPFGTGCVVFADGLPIVCLTSCNPLLDDCVDGESCYASNNSFQCARDRSADEGAFGDPCDYPNSCDLGLFCSDPELVPGCAAAFGCCNAYCDITESDECPGAGQVCGPWYSAGMAPPGLETLGACTLP